MIRPWTGRQFGLRTRIIAAFTLLVVIVAGGTAAAVVITVQRWIYSNAQSIAVSEFKTEMAQLDGKQLSYTTDLRGVLPPDVTAIAGSDLVALGSAKPADINPGFAAEVKNSATDLTNDSDSVVSSRVGTHRVLVGRTIAIRADGIQRDIQVYSIRALPGVKDKITELAAVVTVCFVVGSIVCIAMGAWFATVLVRPLNSLDRAARQAAAGDLSVRLPASGVTELAQVTSAFNYMVEAHGNSVQQLRRFAADVSHELRTPLAALVPMAEVLQEDAADFPADSALAVNVVAAEVHKLAQLVEDLMEISRHDVHAAQLRSEDLDLVVLARETLATRGWSETVTLSAPPSVPTRLDPRRMEVALSNLVGNAIRHGQPPVSVTISTPPGAIHIQVRDHGPGIADEHIDRIFDRFYKVDTARTRSHGSGLGLSLTAENVHLHHGTIEVSSAPGGTTFTIALPNPDESAG